jgi:diguanylate cyclase (GGDEF)-like protein
MAEQGPATTTDLLNALLALHENAVHENEQEIIQRGLELAVTLTDSHIGYFHFVNEDQETIELVTWSRETLAHCTAVYERHYPISAAGIWADCARFKRPIIHNDYQSQPDRKGYPEGHAHLIRHLGVPVIENGMVRVLTGVGNKEAEYDQRDIDLFQRIADTVWRLVKQYREKDELLADRHRMHEVQSFASVTAWECDPEDNIIQFDRMFTGIFADGEPVEPPDTIDEFLVFIEDDDREKVRMTLTTATADSYFTIDIDGRGRGGKTIPLSLRGQVLSRPRGESVIIHGILQDCSERRVMDEIRYKAFHDPLTGLANRNLLMERMLGPSSLFRRSPGDAFALHYVDLDKFKEINDEFGHQVGDELLRKVARRIRRLIRREDLAVRFGGDEFLVVQNAVSDERDAAALAEKIIAAIDHPFLVEGHKINIGASIGITMSRPEESDIDILISESDEALYRSKNMGRDRYSIFRGKG